MNKAVLAGALSGLGGGGLVSVILSLISPADFDFDITRQIGREEEVDPVTDNSEKDLPLAKSEARAREEV